MIFNSLSSNYSWSDAWRNLLSFGRANDRRTLAERLLKDYDGVAVELYDSGRVALKRAVILSGAKRVASNSFSCFVVEQSVVCAGAKPLLLDSSKHSRWRFNFDPATLEAAGKKHSDLGAVIVQNTFGIPIDIRPIEAYCQQRGLVLIEDLAHGLQAVYPDGRGVGTVGDLVMFSFGRDKPVDSGGGGALVIRRPDLKPDAPPEPTPNLNPLVSFNKRIYPLASCLVRASYRWPFLGKIVHQSFKALLVLRPASRKSADELGFRLNANRARAISRNLDGLASQLERRRNLASLYQLDQPVSHGTALVRWPVLVDSSVRSFLLAGLSAAGFNLVDTWYDNPVYPAREPFLTQSSYRANKLPQTTKVCQQIVNLPLHRQITTANARGIQAVVDSYHPFRVDYQPTARRWAQALKKFPAVNLHNGWAAGQAQLAAGYGLRRCLIWAGREPVGLIQAVVRPARRGRYLEVAGGPLWRPATGGQSPLPIIGQILQSWGRQADCVFVRHQSFRSALDEPSQPIGPSYLSPSQLNARHTRLVDLSQPLEVIEAAYRPKVRQRVRVEQKRGLRVELDNSPQRLNDLLGLIDDTVRQQGFTPVGKRQISQQFEAWAKSGQLRLWSAYGPEDELLAMAMMVVEGDQTACLYSGTSSAGRRWRAAAAIRMAAIAAARKEGLAWFNFWGVSPPTAGPRHPLAGVGEFKRGFGGRDFCYWPTQDIVLKPRLYTLTRLIEVWRQKRRGD